MSNVVHKQEFIYWLIYHGTAFEDFCRYFNLDDVDDAIYNIDLDEIVTWLTEHKYLSQDFIVAFSDELYSDVIEMNNEAIIQKVNEMFGL